MEGLSCPLLVRSWHGRRHGENGLVEFENEWGDGVRAILETRLYENYSCRMLCQ